MLFSATQTRKTEDLARISLKKEPIYVGVHDTREIATVGGLEQVNLDIMISEVFCSNIKIVLRQILKLRRYKFVHVTRLILSTSNILFIKYFFTKMSSTSFFRFIF